ncbi:MAG: TonB family protein [Candidatus Neomarinimicrobiota bacterium]|jgi:protein TonB|nr:TonB family protein [Candidatus Neomarinimicrobiota bacterium]
MRLDPLNLNYPIRIRVISLSTILLITVVFYFSPRLKENITSIEKFIPQDIESIVVPPTEQMQIEKPPARPSVPVASEDEFLDDDITIEETDLDDLEDWDAPPPPPDQGRKVKFIPYDKAPVPISPIRPEYPEIAMEAGIEGTVIVQAFISNKGVVEDTMVLKGIPNTGLNEAALEAVKRTRWKPARQRDKKVGVWMSIPINFKLTTN